MLARFRRPDAEEDIFTEEFYRCHGVVERGKTLAATWDVPMLVHYVVNIICDSQWILKLDRGDAKVGFRLVVFVRDAALQQEVMSELHASVRKKKEFVYPDTTRRDGMQRIKRETGVGIARHTRRLLELHNHNMVAVYHVYETLTKTVPCDLLLVDSHVLASVTCIRTQINPIMLEHAPGLLLCHLSEADDSDDDNADVGKKQQAPQQRPKKKKKRADASSVLAHGHPLLRARTCLQYTMAGLFVAFVVSFLWVVFMEGSFLTPRKNGR